MDNLKYRNTFFFICCFLSCYVTDTELSGVSAWARPYFWLFYKEKGEKKHNVMHYRWLSGLWLNGVFADKKWHLTGCFQDWVYTFEAIRRTHFTRWDTEGGQLLIESPRLAGVFLSLCVFNFLYLCAFFLVFQYRNYNSEA